MNKGPADSNLSKIAKEKESDVTTQKTKASPPLNRIDNLRFEFGKSIPISQASSNKYLAKIAKEKELAATTKKTNTSSSSNQLNTLDQVSENTTLNYSSVHDKLVAIIEEKCTKKVEDNCKKQRTKPATTERITKRAKRISAIKKIMLSIWRDNEKWDKKSIREEKERMRTHCHTTGNYDPTEHPYRDPNDAMDELVEEGLLPECFYSKRKKIGST
jgi:hypothetical protein